MLQFRMLSAAMLASALIAASTGIASSQDRQALRDACTGDYQKLCSSVRPGGDRVRQCLLAHGKELTPACKSALEGTNGAPSATPTGTAAQ